MRCSVRKIGDAAAMFIPGEALAAIGVQPGAEVEVRLDGHRLVIESVHAAPPRSGWAADAKRVAEAGDSELSGPESGLLLSGTEIAAPARVAAGGEAFSPDASQAPAGLVVLASPSDAPTTAAKLEAAIAARGLTLFARVDHSAGAAAVGLALEPTILFVFGNAKGGTPLMQLAPSVGIDLPLKALVFEDADGAVHVAYNDPAWLAARHGLGAAADGPVKAMRTLLAALAAEATA